MGIEPTIFTLELVWNYRLYKARPKNSLICFGFWISKSSSIWPHNDQITIQYTNTSSSQSKPTKDFKFFHQRVSESKPRNGNLWMASLYVKAMPPADLNRNTEWFMYPGVWTTYILILFFSWLLVLSIFGCSPGMAWTIVNLTHFVVCNICISLSLS